MDNTKVPIELTPYDAITILSFLREFDYTTHPHLKSLGEVVQRFEDEVCNVIDDEHLEDCKAETKVNQLLDKTPDSPRRK